MKAVSSLWKKPPPTNPFAPWSSNMTPAEDVPDSIYLRNLQLSAVVGSDAWRRPGKEQPVIISLHCGYSVSTAGTSDKVSDTLNYGSMCKVITSAIEANSWPSVGRLVIDFPGFDFRWPVLSSGEVTVQLPKAILRAEGGLEVRGTIKSDENGDGEDYQLVHNVVYWEWTVKRIRVACIIGVNPHERLQKQDVLVDIKADDNDFLYYAYKVERMSDMERWRQLVERTIEVVESSSYETIEALATAIAYAVTNEFIFPKITVRVEKPSALNFVEGAGVEISRKSDVLGQWTDRRSKAQEAKG